MRFTLHAEKSSKKPFLNRSDSSTSNRSHRDIRHWRRRSRAVLYNISGNIGNLSNSFRDTEPRGRHLPLKLFELIRIFNDVTLITQNWLSNFRNFLQNFFVEIIF